MKVLSEDGRFHNGYFGRRMNSLLILATVAATIVQTGHCSYGLLDEDEIESFLNELRSDDSYRDTLSSNRKGKFEWTDQNCDKDYDASDDQSDEDTELFLLRFFDSKIQSTKPIFNKIRVGRFLKKYQRELHAWRRKGALVDWDKETNLTRHNIAIEQKVTLELSTWAERMRKEAKKLSKVGLTCNQKRMLKFILDTTALNEVPLRKELVSLESKISAVYSKAVVCDKTKNNCYHFEPGLIKIMRDTRDYDKLLWAWKGWRDAIGPKVRKDWIKAENLKTRGAREHGYRDVGQFTRHSYENPTFEKDIDNLWKRLEPFYKELHGYVRYKLHQKYGNRVSLTAPIPAHLLGEMWAMKWDGLLDMVEPYPEVGGFEVTKGMLKKNITVHRMFELADEFYRSIGLPKMTPEFWKYSMFTRPKDNRSVVCYASAHNLEGDDVRVKMCASVNSEYLYVVHHEMGHCQYYLGYNRHQPELFQSGANHGFHEAIGDTAALSVISPTHLIKLGILTESTETADIKLKRDLNFLMQKALGKLAFFPFAITMAKWSWDVARGVIPMSELNAGWWRYRERYQGLKPPIERSERDFDPACKYHIANFVPYVRYFVSHILQFQFFEAMCNDAKYEGPLHRCDFAGSKAAGSKFKKMLDMGSSKPGPAALKELTGSSKMSADSVIRYFGPLLKWLKKENKRLGVRTGWD